MAPARTVAIALSAAILAVPAGALGQGTGGAGDEQYADPFENAPAQTGTPTTTGSQADGLSESPDLGMDTDPTGTPTTPPDPTGDGGTTATPPGTLPNTGSDPRLVVLAGLALLLTGLGLRLRTADEVF